MNVQTLNDQLVDNTDNIMLVLEKIGLEPHDKGKYIQSKNIDGDNISAINIYKANLHYENNTRGESGNIYTLVANILNKNFPQSLDFVAKCLGIKNEATLHIKRPFGYFYKDIIRDATENYGENLTTYSEDILPEANNFSYKFVKEGISIPTQRDWGVRYSHEDDAILIPIRNIKGDLVGCKARNNRPDCDFHSRWYAWQGYSKTSVVYGLDKNYFDIAAKRIVFIFESEKSVMKCYDSNFNYSCAIGGHTLSDTQSNILKSLMADRYVICFDSDINNEDELRYNAEKLVVNNTLMKNKVGYIYGGLPPAEKLSPVDPGIKVFKSLVKNNIKWLGM